MRAPQLVSDFLAWRWAPCVGLTAGSLTFVALALVLIPTRIGGEPRLGSTLSTFDSPIPQRAIFSSSLARSMPDRPERRFDEPTVARSLPPPPATSNPTGAPPQRGFSPIIERVETLPPAPAPRPLEPSASASGSVVVVQPVPGGESREVTTQ
jgi:hypothetical protein